MNITVVNLFNVKSVLLVYSYYLLRMYVMFYNKFRYITIVKHSFLVLGLNINKIFKMTADMVKNNVL